jgi:hypothetical protein
MSVQTFTCEVEFVGGPLDGHVEEMWLPLRAFVGVRIVTNRTPESFLRAWFKRWRPNDAQAAVVSIYELGESGARVQYRFLRSQALCEKSLASHHVIDTLVKLLRGGS